MKVKVIELAGNFSDKRLVLPPIQRRAIWDNTRIVNYWDSLLRGFPPGTMLVHPDKDGRQALFDGQQRLATILLAFGDGPFSASRKLWVDLNDLREGDRRTFMLRVTSSGQPFGYRFNNPGAKYDARRQRKAWAAWDGPNNDAESLLLSRQRAFAEGRKLIDAEAPIPFSELIPNDDNAHRLLIDAGVSHEKADEFRSALGQALQLQITLQNVPSHIVESDSLYQLYFSRVGQSPMVLTPDERTYSMLKHIYRNEDLRVSMEEIMGLHGRLIDEVDLVLAALRIARFNVNPDDEKAVRRPTPDDAAALATDEPVRKQFADLVFRANGTAKLGCLMAKTRKALGSGETFLPTLLLARLPAQLVDVILFAESLPAECQWPESALRQLALWWLCFVIEPEKVAALCFDVLKKAGTINQVIAPVSASGGAHRMPTAQDLESLNCNLVNARTLIEDANRFRCTGVDGSVSEGIRHIATKQHKVALMWLQRKYLCKRFSGYDPTSDRDEDIPVDYDHLIPASHLCLNQNWSEARKSRLGIAEDGAARLFKDDARWNIGNSLGNIRILAASENRARGAGPAEPTVLGATVGNEISDDDDSPDVKISVDYDRISNAEFEEFRALNTAFTEGAKKWPPEGTVRAQHLVHGRTLRLISELLHDSGLVAYAQSGGPV